MRAPLLLAAALLLAGCTAAVDDSALAGAGGVAAVATEPTVVAEHTAGSVESFELDVLCLGGGGLPIPRADRAGILPGVARLVATLQMQMGTGLQLGYTVDNGEIQWLPPVGPGTTVLEIPVDPSQTEENGARWAFWHQANLPAPATQDCYTGVILQGWSVRIETALS